MDSIGLYNRIYGWVNSVLNPPSALAENRVKVIISEEDYAYPEREDPFIVIGYTPAALTPVGNGGSRLPISEKSTPGFFETGDVIDNLYNFHDVSDGKINISVDGEVAVDIINLDFTEALSMSAVASILQAEISAVVGVGRVIVQHFYGRTFEDKNYFLFASTKIGAGSSIAISASAAVGTDIFAAEYLNGGSATAGIEDLGTEQIHLTDYEGDIEIRQVYGEGELLQKLVNSSWHDSTVNYLSKNKFSINEIGPIQGIPFKEGHRTIRESMTTIKFSFFGVSKEDIGYISSVGITGTVTDENSDRSHEISIGG